MNEQQEIDDYKDMIEGIANKCRNFHHTDDGALCVDCGDEIFRLTQDLVNSSGIELKIEKECEQMGTVCISRNTMNTFDLHVNDIAEIGSPSGGHSVGIVRQLPDGKEENIIVMNLMTAFNHIFTRNLARLTGLYQETGSFNRTIPGNREMQTDKDVFIMRKIETIPATKIVVEPKPGQYPVAGHYLTEKLKGVPIMGRGGQCIIAPHPVYLNSVLIFLIRDVSIQARSDKTIDAFYQISNETIAAVIDSTTEFEIVNEVRGREAFQVTARKKSTTTSL